MTKPLSPAAPAVAETPRSADMSRLKPEFDSFVEKAVSAIGACDPKPDPVYGHHAGFIASARSVAFHEGKLLEWGIGAIARCNPDLVVLPPDRPMPIVPAAVEVLRGNEWANIQGVRLPSAVHASQSYTPDLFIANRRSHRGLIIDVKRSLASYSEYRLDNLRFRMLAVSAIASSWLQERQGPILVEVTTAIVDGSDERRDHDRGVFGLSEVGDLFEVDGATQALRCLRAMFAERVQQELDEQCASTLARRKPHRTPGIRGGLPDNADYDGAAGEAKDSDDSAPATETSAPIPFPAIRPNVQIGYARLRASP